MRVFISHIPQLHVYHRLSFREAFHGLDEIRFFVLEETLLVFLGGKVLAGRYHALVRLL